MTRQAAVGSPMERPVLQGTAGAAYVPRPDRVAERMAMLVRSGLGPVAVTGARGSGRSEELERLETLLADDRVVMRIEVDRLLDVSRLTPELLLFDLARNLLERVATEDAYEGVQPSRGLLKDMQASDPRFAQGNGKVRPPLELARMALGEVEVTLGRGPLTLLVDGLDGAPNSRDAVARLFELSDSADLVVVVDPALVYGPKAHDLLRVARVQPVEPVAVEGVEGEAGRSFLVELGRRRLGQGVGDPHEGLQALVEPSGGLPGTFLHLLHDAWGYAAAAGRAWLDEIDWAAAIEDRADALGRLLRDGDRRHLVQATGTSGEEVPLGRRVRLLSMGLLLERGRGPARRVSPHPLLGL